MIPRRAIVLAAGFGTRMRELTADRPKPLLPVADRALIDHALDRLAGAGVAEAVVNLHYLGDQIRAHLAGRARPLIRFSEERPEILDTGGGVRKALGLLGPQPFIVMNSDAIWTGSCPLTRLAETWDPTLMDGLMLLVRREDAVAHAGPGDFFLRREGAVPKRRGKSEKAPKVFTGLQILKPSALSGMPEGAFSMNEVWDRLIRGGRLAAVTHEGGWIDVGTPEGLAEAERLLAAEPEG